MSHFDSGLFDMNGSREIIQGGHRAFQRGVESIAQRRPVIEIAGFCGFVVAYYFAYGYGMSFSQAAASPFWFPDSVLLCALLISPPRRWWILILAILPIRLFSEVAAGIPTWFLLATFAIDSAKGIVTALVLRWLIDNPLRLKTVREFALYLSLCGTAGSRCRRLCRRGGADHFRSRLLAFMAAMVSR